MRKVVVKEEARIEEILDIWILIRSSCTRGRALSGPVYLLPQQEPLRNETPLL